MTRHSRYHNYLARRKWASAVVQKRQTSDLDSDLTGRGAVNAADVSQSVDIRMVLTSHWKRRERIQDVHSWIQGRCKERAFQRAQAADKGSFVVTFDL